MDKIDKATAEYMRLRQRVSMIQERISSASAHREQSALALATAKAVERAKIRICRQRADERRVALSPYAALDWDIRALRYAWKAALLEDGPFYEAQRSLDPEGLADLAREELAAEDSMAEAVKAAHPNTFYWSLHPLVHRSEYRLLSGHGARMNAQVTPTYARLGERDPYPETRYHVLMMTSRYPPAPGEPWFEGPVDFYSWEDAHAWVEQMLTEPASTK